MDHEDSDEYPDCEEYFPYVIGSNIIQRNGEKVTCLGQVTNLDDEGDNFTIRTVDDQDIVVRLSTPLLEPLEGWVEVFGVAKGKSIECKHLIMISCQKDVDKDGHKALAQLLTALDDPWNLGEQQNGHDGVVPME